MEQELTVEQKATIQEFAVKHGVTAEKALRFILGRKWDLERADELIRNYDKMVRDKGLDRLAIKDVLDELSTGKLTIPGATAKDGSSILLITATKHTPGKFKSEDTIKLAFYLAEVITEDVRTQEIGITIIVNMSGLTWKQSDYTFYRDVVQLFQNNVPCRVKNVLVYQPPWWLDLLLKFVSAFMKPKLRGRIKTLWEAGEFLEYIDNDELPEELGGTLHVDHEAFVKRQLAKESTARMAGLLAGEGETGLVSIPLQSDERVTDQLAAELVEERRAAVQELEAAIHRRRQSLGEAERPIDFTQLARSRAARMSLSLTEAIPLVTPTATAVAATTRPASTLTGLQGGEDVVGKLPEKEQPAPPPPQPSPEQQTELRGFLALSEGESDDKADADRVQEEQTHEEDQVQEQQEPMRRRRSKKARPTAMMG